MTLVSDSEGQVFFSFAAWLEDVLWESCSTQHREQVWVQAPTWMKSCTDICLSLGFNRAVSCPLVN